MPPGGLFLPDPVDLGESSAPARVRCGAIIRAVFADQSTPGIALSLLPLTSSRIKTTTTGKTQLAQQSAGDRGRNCRDVKTLFREIGMLAEVFEADASCGACGSSDIAKIEVNDPTSLSLRRSFRPTEAR